MRRIIVAIVLAFLWFAAAPGAPAEARPTVSAVRTSAEADRTRVVLDVSSAVPFTLFGLADPYRIVLDLPDIDWRATQPAFESTVGVVAGMRYGRFRPDTGRVVLDLTMPAEVLLAEMLPPAERGGPYRLVVDLRQTDARSFLAALARPAVVAPDAAAGPAPPQRRVVVIDPGHGGVDPGAVAPSGHFEKDLTLGFGRDLRDRLEATGRYQVVMTRDSDIFLSLRDRVNRARAAGGELFISLHADSIDDAGVRGGAVYTLSETASDKEAAALAARENKADVIAGVTLDVADRDIASILIDLAQRETMNRSSVFASAAVHSMSSGSVRLRKRPHRFAGFRVLKAPDVPSVLVELGYLSNRSDERFLRSAAGRAAINGALLEAVDNYFRDVRD